MARGKFQESAKKCSCLTKPVTFEVDVNRLNPYECTGDGLSSLRNVGLMDLRNHFWSTGDLQIQRIPSNVSAVEDFVIN